jgi:hypothetical protein
VVFFDPASGLIKEIRAYDAAPAVRDTAQLTRINGTQMGEHWWVLIVQDAGIT